MSDAFDHLHIKRHTAGSSNELSFDVLDAARDGYSPKKKRFGRSSGPQVLKPVKSQEPAVGTREEQQTPAAPQIPKEEQKGAIVRPSLHRAQGKSILSAQEEVTSRKRSRRMRSIRIGVIATLVAVAAMVLTAYAGYQHYEQMQLFKGKYDSLVQLFIEADDALPLTDAFMADPFGATEEEMGEMQKATARSELLLQQVSDERALAADYTVTEQDEEALEQMGEASSLRLAMIGAANRAYGIVSNSDTQASEVNAVWHRVMSADEKARKAAVAANEANSDEAISAAREQTSAARDEMEGILKDLQQIARKRTDLDLSAHIAYMQKRIESLDHAIATGDALLKSDKQTAADENESYNELDRQAAELAKKLPLSAEQTVEEAFEDEVRACIADYDEARDRAIESDALIRQYLRS